MLFNSWEFLILLLITVPLYYLPMGGSRRRVWQIALLLAASAVFYAWEEPRLLILLAFSCVANAVAVERILFWKNKIRCFGESVACGSVDRLDATAPHGESVNEESKEPCAATDPCAST